MSILQKYVEFYNVPINSFQLFVRRRPRVRLPGEPLRHEGLRLLLQERQRRVGPGRLHVPRHDVNTRREEELSRQSKEIVL